MKKLFLLLFILLSVSASQAQIKKFKSAVLDTNITITSTSLVTTTLGFTMDSSRAADTNQVWVVDGCLFTGSSAASGLAFGYTLATNDTANIAFFGTDSTLLQTEFDEITATATAGHAWNCANAQTGKVFVHGTIVTANGGATKTFTLTFKSLVSGNKTLRRKSYLTFTRIR